jgi:hypothetical protein
MAAITPSSIRNISLGSALGTIADFANTADDADTWASGIPDIIGVIITQEDTAGTQASTGIGASFAAATGTITFHIGEDNSAFRLIVLSGQAF